MVFYMFNFLLHTSAAIKTNGCGMCGAETILIKYKTHEKQQRNKLNPACVEEHGDEEEMIQH